MPASLRARVIIALVAALFVCTIPAHGQGNPGDVCPPKDNAKDGKPHHCNGISVGAPKVFDNRTLTLMLESLSQTLLAQQQSYIDKKSVLAALSNIQGFSQTDTTTNLSITGSPTPATSVQNTVNTGLVDANGNPLPNTTQRQTNVTNASVTPQAPTLDTTPAFQGFNPTYGSSASDLLNDQVNLTYQIFNLRMILERSLSDRLAFSGNTRLQAVLGFNVTIDPPRTANDAVAVVEITLKSQDGRDLSLVSLMPQEKTYNAAALSSKSNAFAGSAAVSAFQIGLSTRKRSQIFYLYRDTDTVSYERMTGDPKMIVFGWMFRPVLGRRSISPGLRQLFAIMALPNVDCTIAGAEKDKDGNPCTAILLPTVRTYWKKYDRATLTSFESQDANLASRFWYGLSLGLARPQIFDDHKYENTADYSSLVVQSSATYQLDLTPRVDSVEWRPIGAKNVIVSVKGNNFFTSTQVAIGDKIYAKPEDGLILKSNQGFDLTAPVDAFVNGPGTIIGRYGVGVPLIQRTPPDGFGENGVKILGASINPALAGHHRIQIQIQGIPGAEVLSRSTPVISVNGKALEPPYHRSTGKGGVAEIQADVPDADLADGGGLVEVSWPFYPDKWTDSLPFYDPDKAFEVTRVSPKSILIHRIDGPSFKNGPENTDKSTCWHLIAGDEELPLTAGCPPKPAPNPDPSQPVPSKKDKTKTKTPATPLPAFSDYVVTATVDSLPDKVVLVAPSGSIYNLTIPALKAKDDKAGPIELKQYDAEWIEIKSTDLTTSSAPATGAAPAANAKSGPDFRKVTLVEANGKPLAFVLPPEEKTASADAKAGAADKTKKTPPPIKSIKVEITRELTSKPGTVDIAFHAGAQLLGTRQLHITQTDWSNKGDK
ncbi:MAG: hypothetical protein ABSD76_16880 [Terriglobales bacterium]